MHPHPDALPTWDEWNHIQQRNLECERFQLERGATTSYHNGDSAKRIADINKALDKLAEDVERDKYDRHYPEY